VSSEHTQPFERLSIFELWYLLVEGDAANQDVCFRSRHCTSEVVNATDLYNRYDVRFIYIQSHRIAK
jgi:hypothetical protein